MTGASNITYHWCQYLPTDERVCVYFVDANGQRYVGRKPDDMAEGWWAEAYELGPISLTESLR
jgi:hypothetical protein